MRRKIAVIVLVLVVAIFLAGPVFEHFDRWDHFPQSGNDILLTLVAVVVCLGAALSLIRKTETNTSSSDVPPQTASGQQKPSMRENFLQSDPPGLHQSPLRI